MYILGMLKITDLPFKTIEDATKYFGPLLRMSRESNSISFLVKVGNRTSLGAAAVVAEGTPDSILEQEALANLNEQLALRIEYKNDVCGA